MKKVAYIGLFLTSSACERLKWFLPAGLEGWTEYCHHVTLWHKANKRPLPLSEDEIRALPWGKDFAVTPWNWYLDDKGVAFGDLQFSEVLPTLDVHQNLHITGACAPGVSPVYSNQIVGKSGLRQSIPHGVFWATLGWCSGGPSWSPTSPI